MGNVSVGQIWHSPRLNVFDRKIVKMDDKWIYFDSDGATWGWISRADFMQWVHSNRAIPMGGVMDAIQKGGE